MAEIYNQIEESKMRVDQAIRIHLEYHKANSGKNTIESYSATLSKFRDQIADYSFLQANTVFLQYHIEITGVS